MKLLKFIFICLLLFPLNIAHANSEWIWVCSNDYHTHFYSPDNMEFKRGEEGNVIRVSLWRKTTYNQAGAQAEFNKYKELSERSTPSQLAYSTQWLELNLQRRETVSYTHLIKD